ncbi:MAG: ABC transporter substrate-binding protein [Arcobacter sp.]|nr:ABC transporter substrate-binding protein [Arcobacter sp.]
MNILKFIIGLTLLLLHLDAKELEKVSIQLNSFHKFQFAGYYIAKEKGYYEDLNLDVDIKEFNFDINLVNDVIKQKSEYAVGNSSLIIDKLENKNIILISAIFQNSPKVLLTLKSSNIIYPNNLKDKKIMLNQNLNDTASIKSMLISQGLQLNDIKFLKHSNLLDDLINGKTDAFSSDLSTGPYLLSQKNIEFNVHNPSDYGFYFYSGILFTSKKELNKYPLRVKKIYKATKKGWEYAFKNIEETSKLIFNKYNTKNKTLDALIYEGQVLKRLAKFNEGKLGDINIKKIDDIKRLFLLLGLNKYNSNVKLNDFIYDSTKISLSKKEQEYLDKNKLTLVTNTFSQPFTIKSKKGLNGIEIDIWNLINKKLKIRSNVKIINNHDLAIEKIKTE